MNILKERIQIQNNRDDQEAIRKAKWRPYDCISEAKK